MNKEIELLHNKIDAQDKIINEQALEIAELKRSEEWWQERFYGQQVYDDSNRIIAKEYKKRIDKAIEIVKLCNTKCSKEVIEILGDKENE